MRKTIGFISDTHGGIDETLRALDVLKDCGTDASHHIERTNIKAIESTEKLLRAYLEN